MVGRVNISHAIVLSICVVLSVLSLYFLRAFDSRDSTVGKSDPEEVHHRNSFRWYACSTVIVKNIRNELK